MSSSAPYRSGDPAETPDGTRRGRHGVLPAHRFWSVRRLPAALVAAVLLGAAGLLLYDIIAVRAGRSTMYWRRWLTAELATTPLDNTWVITGAAIAMAVGVWLILLALTPGLRNLLPMRRDSDQVRAGIDRDAAALTLRDRAMEVSGVQAVRVRMGRHRVKVRARAHFRPVDDVREDLGTALGAGIGELGLAKDPGLSVQVRRPRKKR